MTSYYSLKIVIITMQQNLSEGLTCPTHQKQMQQLTHVCLDPGCADGLLCARCIYPDHKDHPFMNFRLFAAAAEQMQYDCTLQERKERVVKRKLEFIESIGSMRTAINKQLSLAESAVEKYFREVHDRLTAIQKREEAVKFNLISIGLKQADLFSQEIIALRKKYIQKQSIRIELSNAVASAQIYAQKHMASIDEMRKAIRDLNLMISSVSQVMEAKQTQPQLNNLQKILYKRENRIISKTVDIQKKAPIRIKSNWSSQLKHQYIEVCGSRINRTVDGKNRYDYFSVSCLIDIIIEDTSIEQHCWEIEVNQLKQNIGVGICQINQAQEHYFEKWDWSNIGHGHYCVYSNGHIFSHSNPNKNQKSQNLFRFKAGDVMRFGYDPKNGKLKITNNSQYYEMDIQKNKGNKYTICTYLCGIGDSVTII